GLRRITQIHIFYPTHSFKEFELNWKQVKKNLAATSLVFPLQRPFVSLLRGNHGPGRPQRFHRHRRNREFLARRRASASDSTRREQAPRCPGSTARCAPVRSS